MVDIYKLLFASLKERGCFYCCWKSTHELNATLNGKGDLDLYIPIKDRGIFVEEALKFGFKPVESYVSKFPFVQHFLGYDVRTSKVIHLHVYFRIVTGASNTKNYIFPLDAWIRKNINKESDFPVLNDNAQFLLHLLRHYLKIGSPLGAFLYFRSSEKYSGELNNINDRSIDCLPEFLSSELYSLLRVNFERKSFLGELKFSFKVKKLLAPYRRKNFAVSSVSELTNTIKRILNKVFLKNNKILSDGIIIAICGLDGSGKSTALNSLENDFGSKISTRLVHFGRPRATMLTFPSWMLFRSFEYIKHSKKSNSKSVESLTKKREVSLLAAFRYSLLSYERYRSVRRASRYASKGYLVLFDRYTTLDYGKMDSPRILYDENRTFIYQWFHKIESYFYRAIPPCDVCFYLNVPVQVSLKRNRARTKFGKETDSEIRARHIINSNLRYKTDNYVCIDATKSQDTVLKTLKSEIWGTL